jgi:formamidase
MDVKQLGRGTTVTFAVEVPGALFSVGDPHFAQGDGESCGVAIEMAARTTLRFRLRKAADVRWRPGNPAFVYEEPPSPAPRRFVATTGVSVDLEGRNGFLDVLAAATNAMDELVDYLLQERGLSPNQAYVLVSVAADLKISEIVDVPNALVSAVLPLDIFEEDRDGRG